MQQLENICPPGDYRVTGAVVDDSETEASDRPDVDAVEISRFVDLIFRHARSGNVCLLSLGDAGNRDAYVDRRWAPAADRIAISQTARDVAEDAAQGLPRVFCPPLASFHGGATEAQIVEAYTLSVDLDSGLPAASLETLSDILGPPTVVVETGGLLQATEAGAALAKLHAHWRLNAPARSDDIAALKEARTLMAALAGADRTGISPAHPFRWPGSLHRKGASRLARIVSAEPDAEVDLRGALVALRGAATTRGLQPMRERAQPGEVHAPASWSDDERRAANRIIDDHLSWLARAKVGERGSTLNRVAFYLGQAVAAGCIPREVAIDRLWASVEANGLEAQDGRQSIAATIDRALSAGAGAVGDFIVRVKEEASRAARGAEIAEMIMSRGEQSTHGRETRDNTETSGGSAGASARMPWLAKPFVWTDPQAIPPRQWLRGRHLIRGFVSATIAPGGVGKSSLVITEAVAMASGRDLLQQGLPAGRLRVLIWQGEDPQDEVQRRIAATCHLYGVLPEGVEGYLFVVSGRDQPIVLATQGQGGVSPNSALIADLKSTIRDNRIDVVFVDPFVSSHAVQENDNSAMDFVVKAWASIADATGCAVDLVHHARKLNGQEASVEDGRGASALLAAVRAARTLNPMSEADEASKGIPKDEWSRWFRAVAGKANLAPRGGPADWHYLESVDLGNGDATYPDGDSVGVVVRRDPMVPTTDPLFGISDEQIHAIQCKIEDLGDRIMGGKSGNWAGHVIAGILGGLYLTGVGKGDPRRVTPVLDALIEKGFLRKDLGYSKGRNQVFFVKVGAWIELPSETPSWAGDGPRGWAKRRLADEDTELESA